jgi:hypothetical protein
MKIRLPTPTKVWVIGKGFLPTQDEIGAALRGFHEKHDYLEWRSPVPQQSVVADRVDTNRFCEGARDIVFRAKPRGAYFLDAVILLTPHFATAFSVEEALLFDSSPLPLMMISVVWEGDDARTAQQLVTERQGV